MPQGNPMGITGEWKGNFIQPGTENPPHNPKIGDVPFTPDVAAGPNHAGNYQAPDTQKPAQPANQPAIASHPVGRDTLGLTYPLPVRKE